MSKNTVYHAQHAHLKKRGLVQITMKIKKQKQTNNRKNITEINMGNSNIDQIKTRHSALNLALKSIEGVSEANHQLMFTK